jgi:hypothetical protein
MTRMLCTLVSGLAFVLTGTAQTRPAAPQAYGFQAASKMLGQMDIKVRRNVSKELIEITGAGYHIRSLYDFQAYRIYTTDLDSNKCTMQEYRSAYAPTFHDPIGAVAEFYKQGGPPPTVRTETVNGIAAKKAETEGQKIWLEAQYGYGFPVKIEVGGQTVFEMRNLVYGLSAPSFFAIPANCTPVGGYGDANGGHYESGPPAGAGASASASVPSGGGANSGSGAANGTAAAQTGGKVLVGEWTFTGKDGKGVAWEGKLGIQPLDSNSFDPAKYSNMCNLDVQSPEGGARGAYGACLYNAQSRTLTWASNDFSLAAVLSPDGKSLTQGKWVEKATTSSWSAKR